MAAVYGPLAPLNLSKEKEQAIVSLLIKSGRPDQAMIEHEWTDFLIKVLGSCIDTSLYPRTVVQIVLQITQADGSTLASMLHAAVAALMDAGVELLYLPTATTCLIRPPISGGRGSILLDPNSVEEEEADTTVVVLVNEPNRKEKTLGSHTVGPGCSVDELLSCTQMASKTCSAIVTFWRLAVEQKVTRESQTLWSK